MKRGWTGLGMAALLAAAIVFGAAPAHGQAPGAPSAVSVYSTWVRLSLRGYSQEEIESLLRNLDPKTVEEVKARLRRSVLANLQLKKVREHFLTGRDSGDLRDVLSSIQTEIRFAGLENDDELKAQIREKLGIPLNHL